MLSQNVSIWFSSSTVDPQYNEPPNNEVLTMTNNFFYPSNSKIYEKEPQYNETPISEQISPVPWFFVTTWFHCTLFLYNNS